uniref:NlpC/P60 domain-containing protein n=1 Tax=Calidris pygmaea TaxID=425635 RepID=A0A8C3JAD2_9CHAR
MSFCCSTCATITGVAGAASTVAFFFCEGLLGQHFDVVPDGVAQPQPGDLFLFPLDSGGPGWWGAHAGVYCGDGEIIHLEGESPRRWSRHGHVFMEGTKSTRTLPFTHGKDG